MLFVETYPQCWGKRAYACYEVRHLLATSRSRRNRIESGYRIIDDHLKDKDISGAIRDIKGNPVLDKSGVPYQHYKEVDDAVHGLKKERDSLVKSIKNPNLTPEVKKSIRDAINEFDIKINEWERIKRGN